MSDINYIIIHYLNGTATLEEKRTLLTWLKYSTENQKEFLEIKALWQGENVVLSEKRMDVALEKFRKRIYRSLEEKKELNNKKFIHFLRIAAMFLLAFGLNYLLFMKVGKPEQNTEIINRLITAENGKGRFLLPDSTVVWLNQNSTLEYPEKFKSDSRRVQLKGEAYFQVQKNPDKEFLVNADDIWVKVTGTSFVVQNYENRKAVETILVDGSVSVGNTNIQSIDLSPNQRISFEKQSNSFQVDSVNALNYIGWINRRLEFDRTNLSDALIQMGEWYGIDIVYTQIQKKQPRLTFMIRDESIEEILKAMQMVTSFHYKWEEQTLYVNPDKETKSKHVQP